MSTSPGRESECSPAPLPLPDGNGDDLAFRVDYAPLFAGSARMRALLHDIRQVADTGATVLIQGESGGWSSCRTSPSCARS